MKFYTRINQGLKSCLVKVSSRSVDAKLSILYTLKIVDFNHFYRCQALCAGDQGCICKSEKVREIPHHIRKTAGFMFFVRDFQFDLKDHILIKTSFCPVFIESSIKTG